MADETSKDDKQKATTAKSLPTAEYAQLSQEVTAVHHEVSNLASKKAASSSDPTINHIGSETLSTTPTNLHEAETIAAVMPTIEFNASGKEPVTAAKTSLPKSLRTISTAVPVDDGPYIGEIGDYLLIEQIGRGGMGVVYKAHQRKVGRVVALKVIAAGSLCAPEDIARFHDEATAAGRLNHPGIVAVYDAGEHNGTHFFSMAYVEGSSLASFVGADKPRLEVRRAAALMEKVCRAVQYAHDRAVIHRDIKPANIMLDKSGNPLLTDFGLAKLIGNEGLTMTGQVMGTPNYMAPEQAKGQQDLISTRTDVYSLGATLYALLAGTPAFAGKNLIETLRKVESAAPEPLTYKGSPVPLDLWIICEKSLAKRPDDRYDSAGALADDLDRFLNGFPISARAVGPTTRLVRWSQRNPIIAALIGTVAATLVIATIVSAVLAIKARAEKARAEVNLAFIEDVLEDVLVSVSEDDLSNQPGTQMVRERLLEVAQDYYQQLSMTQQISAEKVADAAFLLGRVQGSLGMNDKAEDSLNEALEIQTNMLASAEDQVEALTDIAATHKELAKLGEKLWNDGSVGEPSNEAKEALAASIEHSLKCVEFRAKALELESEDPELARLVGSAKMSLGLALIQQARWDSEGNSDWSAAEKSLEEAEKLWAQALKKTPNDPELLKDIARGRAAFGDLREAQANQFVESDKAKYESLVRESLELRQDAAEKFSKLPATAVNPETRSQLATCFQLQAESYYQLGLADEAIQYYQLTVGVLRQLLMSNPLVDKYRIGVAQNQFMLAQLYFSKGDDLGYTSAYEFQQTLVDGLAIEPGDKKITNLLLDFTRAMAEGLVASDLVPEALNQIENAKHMLEDIQTLDADKPAIEAVIEQLDQMRQEFDGGDRTA
jgi:eukaryotic-like serine/threonine-protein kinase